MLVPAVMGVEKAEFVSPPQNTALYELNTVANTYITIAM
jgi:hypothetical protein